MASTETTANRTGPPLGRLGFVVGFLPWIVFSVVAQRLAANGVAWSALLAVAMTVAALLLGRRRHAPRILNLCSLVLFAAMALIGFAGGSGVDEWLFDWGRPLVGVVLGLFVMATVPILPFTAEYARQSTPREYWDSPTFTTINRVLSATWGVALLLIGAAALAVTALDAQATDPGRSHLPDLLLNWVVPIAVLWWTIRFTMTYPDRAGGRDGPPRSPSTSTTGGMEEAATDRSVGAAAGRPRRRRWRGGRRGERPDDTGPVPDRAERAAPGGDR